MIVYTIGQQSDTLVTLNESTTLVNPYYLFVFTNVSTKVVYTQIVNSTSDVFHEGQEDENHEVICCVISDFSVLLPSFSSKNADFRYSRNTN